MQSVYRRFHSTETAVTKVYNDLLLAADVGQVSVLCLVDLTAAFDTVDHQLLLHRLERQYSLRGVVSAWFSSYLTDRSFRVWYNGDMSFVVYVLCSAPQGSVLGPRLFAFYTADLDEVTSQRNVYLHSYAEILSCMSTVSVVTRHPLLHASDIVSMTFAIGWQQIVCR